MTSSSRIPFSASLGRRRARICVNLVKALRGGAPFGKDIGTAGATIRRMPAGRAPVADGQIAFIEQWIDEVARGRDPAGAADVACDQCTAGRPTRRQAVRRSLVRDTEDRVGSEQRREDLAHR